MTGVIELAEVLAKAMLYFGILTSNGLVLVSIVFGKLLEPHGRRIRAWAIGFSVIGLTAAALGFSMLGAMLTGEMSGMFDREMLGILWSTPSGTTLVLRVAGMVVVAAGVLLGGGGLWLAALGGLAALWSFAGVGHVSGVGLLGLKLLLIVHLAGISFWIGILLPLKWLVSNPVTLERAARVGLRFGRIAGIFVPAVLMAGVGMAWILVGSLENLVKTGYGQALLVKVVIVTCLLGVAAANKLRFVPMIASGNFAGARRLSTMIAFEWTAFLAILVTTAYFTSRFPVPS